MATLLARGKEVNRAILIMAKGRRPNLVVSRGKWPPYCKPINSELRHDYIYYVFRKLYRGYLPRGFKFRMTPRFIGGREGVFSSANRILLCASKWVLRVVAYVRKNASYSN